MLGQAKGYYYSRGPKNYFGPLPDQQTAGSRRYQAHQKKSKKA
jgi:hypothetical protein